MAKTYDPKCYELAEYFLSDYEKVPILKVEELAAAIQQAIEDWLEDEMRKEREGD